MSRQENGDSEDEILEQLNRELEEEKEQKRIDAEVERRLSEREESSEESAGKKEPRKAQFTGRKGEKRQVERKPREPLPECHYCGSKESTRLDDGETIIKYRNKDFDGILKQVRHCKSCGKRFGVA